MRTIATIDQVNLFYCTGPIFLLCVKNIREKSRNIPKSHPFFPLFYWSSKMRCYYKNVLPFSTTMLISLLFFLVISKCSTIWTSSLKPRNLITFHKFASLFRFLFFPLFLIQDPCLRRYFLWNSKRMGLQFFVSTFYRSTFAMWSNSTWWAWCSYRAFVRFFVASSVAWHQNLLSSKHTLQLGGKFLCLNQNILPLVEIQ